MVNVPHVKKILCLCEMLEAMMFCQNISDGFHGASDKFYVVSLRYQVSDFQ